MVSKNQIKQISSLKHKKFRSEHQLFIAEGIKVIQELLNSNFELEHLYTTLNDFENVSSDKRTQINETIMQKLSALNSPSSCLAVFKTIKQKPPKTQGLLLALDDIRDPGNFGTILRLCDWFGISNIVCSQETVDIYNPKVIQATMGSLARVNVYYTNLHRFLGRYDGPILGTFMDGDNVYKTQLPQNGILVMGNEANGITAEIEKLITQKISIPRFGDIQKTESLNVATATAIFLSEFKRN